MKPVIQDKRVLIGALFILAGLVLIVDRILAVDIIPGWIWTWQFFLIVIGVVSLLTSDKVAPGIILIAVGSYFLFPGIFKGTWFYENLFRSHLLLYLFLIFIGLILIIKGGNMQRSPHYHRALEGAEFKDDYLNEVAVFGGGEKIITSDNFRGGNITTIFGGTDLNLTQAKLAEGIKEIDIFTMFGGWTLIVPAGWNVKIDVFSIFGGVSDKRSIGADMVRDNTRTLLLKGFVMFGGGEIKSVK